MLCPVFIVTKIRCLLLCLIPVQSQFRKSWTRIALKYCAPSMPVLVTVRGTGFCICWNDVDVKEKVLGLWCYCWFNNDSQTITRVFCLITVAKRKGREIRYYSNVNLNRPLSITKAPSSPCWEFAITDNIVIIFFFVTFDLLRLRHHLLVFKKDVKK